MSLFDFIRKRAPMPDNTDSTRGNAVSTGIHTIADYLHYVDSIIDVNLNDLRNFRGRLVDLSDDGHKLVMTDVTEYSFSNMHEEVTVAHHSRKLIPVAEIRIVEVKDRRI